MEMERSTWGEKAEEDKSRDGWTVCVNRDMTLRAIDPSGTTKYDVLDITNWRRNVSVAAIPQLNGNVWQK